jgi:hypothetical protein
LASGIRDSNALVAEQSPCGAGHIVWMTFGCLPDGGAGEVTSARKDGSDRRQIGTSACLHDLTGGDSYVAWATAETVHAARWDGADMHLVSSVGDSYRVAAVGDTVYWGSTQDSTIGKHSLVGPACDPNCKFTDARERVLSMGANHGPVFYGTQDGGAVWRLLDDGGSQLVADGLAYPGHIAPDGDRVFWISDGRIYRADLDAGTAAPFVTENAWALAVHGGALFWTVENEVHSLDLDGGQLKTIARNQAAPHAIAADDVAVYWLNYGTTPEGADGQLMKLDRD